MNWDTNRTNPLFQAILDLEDLNEVKRFLRDLLTENEIIEFANRWQVAQLLDQKVPYSQIKKETGLSSATISRISKWLNAGMGGYRLMLDKNAHHNHSPS